MVPDPQSLRDHMENPVRDSAIHFGAYLQLLDALGRHPVDSNVGVISTSQLLDIFTNQYQPQFHTSLVRPNLLNTLIQYQVVRKRNKNEKTNKTVRVVKHPHPSQVQPPTLVTRARVYVDQTGVFRDKIQRPEVVNQTKCRLCDVSFINEQSKEQHIDDDEHKFRLLYREKRSSFKSAVGGASFFIANRNVDDKEVILRLGEQCHLNINVSLGGQTYTEANIIKIFKNFNLGEISVTPLTFLNNVPIEVNVSAKFEEPGAYLYPLVAKVMSTNRLCLLKDLIFRVESELMDELAPTAPYIHQKETIIREMEGPILPAEYIEQNKFKLVIKVPLGSFEVPHYYNKFLIHKLERYDNMSEKDEENLKRMLSLLCGPLSYKEALSQVAQSKAPFITPLEPDTYSDRFALLAHLEELQEQRQVKNYDRIDQVLKRCNTLFFLEVPDLSEGRPSVKKGDKVHVQFHHNNEWIYEAMIIEIKAEGLLLSLHRQFTEEYRKVENMGRRPKVDVRFTVNRFPYMNMHRALSLIQKHKALKIVFPEKKNEGGYMPPTRTLTLKPWINPLIGTNPEQQIAVRNIVQKSSGTAPYLVFGPPGTGKTVTLVEAITQVWHASLGKAVRQLVCAPSNAACNNIASRLISVLPRTAKILRLFSMSSDDINIPEDLINHSNYNKEKGYVTMPTIGKILENHIVIVTIVSAGRIVTGGGGGNFQYVYIDECGQACEPEALIAIAGVLTTKSCASTGQLVLAGDPQQLGPILSSQPAKDFGLGMSLLERLMNHNSLYKRHESSGYDTNYLTKLVQNFRSHRSILHIPNMLFYDNELQVKGNPDIINSAVGWSELPNPDFPLIFHGVQGQDERESNSPSYFNRQEIDVVLMYIEKLLRNGLPKKYKVKEDDIGIITPYRKQVQKFRKALDLKRWDIRVGSVEEFQGSEKLIIFISTVRSTMELVDEDYFFKLGFLKNPKRFNVSVTRAKALLIVVGNPNILRHDKQWYHLLEYCHNNRAYKGIPFEELSPPEHELVHISS
ncbi:putative helicase MOV-10 [Macrosteles quadrilineatus]|uniref:putative helicase MOV-10 n=1 Tax=Macrosteles quadrilineatus TaxID=74068 RepID=UPI0023E3027E|nr:putative helicase MOV-10 [Macrosteles quadrilineatus]